MHGDNTRHQAARASLKKTAVDGCVRKNMLVCSFVVNKVVYAANPVQFALQVWQHPNVGVSQQWLAYR